MTELRRFVVEDGSDMSMLVSGLEQRAPFDREPDRVVERTVYDTFDWRLHDEGTVLEHEREVPIPPARGGRLPQAAPPVLIWRASETGEVLGRIVVDDVPRFASDLPSGPIADRLAAILEMRALLPLVTIRDRQTALRLLDEEGKTQARVLIDQATLLAAGTEIHAEADRDPVVRTDVYEPAHAAEPAVARSPELDPRVEVLPVRGYPRAADDVAALLAAQVVLRPVDRDVVTESLHRVGLTPGGYSSKLKVRLDPASTALDVVVAVLSALLSTMLVNEPGTRADTDSEFLHDFRVAVRRSRSVLGFAKGVVPPDLLEHFRAEFKWLGDITTPTRDLDVYLLTYDDFESSLPEPIRPDLHPLLSFLVEQKGLAQAELVANLDSERYTALLTRYRAWLTDPSGQAGDPEATPDASTPAVEFAASRIWKAYRSLVKDGRRITDDTPPPQVHELRKDGKKLRYALECFASLFPADEVGPLVKELKGVQDVLGDFQDAEVQKVSLRHFGEALVAERGPEAATTLLAMGYLIEQLDEREQRARSMFADRFERFDAHHNRVRFRRLFHPDHDGPHEPSPGSGDAADHADGPDGTHDTRTSG
ncbi:MAG: CHAD domain-containing protein [Acidimicrobiales bacterium]